MRGGPTGTPGASGAHLEGVLDPQLVLEAIGLVSGMALLDAGCGEGRFSIPAASMVGDKGKVYAVDTSQERVEALRAAALSHGLDQIEPFVADVTETIPVPADTVDVCVVANVLHGLVENGNAEGALSEIKRVLRPDGVLAIVEFKKDVDRPPGPPLSVRLDPGEVDRLLSQHGFELRRSSEVGSFHYLSLFAARKAEG